MSIVKGQEIEGGTHLSKQLSMFFAFSVSLCSALSCQSPACHSLTSKLQTALPLEFWFSPVFIVNYRQYTKCMLISGLKIDQLCPKHMDVIKRGRLLPNNISIEQLVWKRINVKWPKTYTFIAIYIVRCWYLSCFILHSKVFSEGNISLSMILSCDFLFSFRFFLSHFKF